MHIEKCITLCHHINDNDVIYIRIFKVDMGEDDIMKVIAVANQKGGIGKTTTAVALASILNAREHKTLFIDADTQRNSTDTYRAKYDGVPTLYDVILEESSPLKLSEVIQHTEAGDIVAADPLLAEAESKLSAKGLKGYQAIKTALKDIKDDYEYVIFDTPPAVNMLLRNVLIASDDVIVPITPDRYGFQGFSDFAETINDIKQLNSNLSVAGILLVKYDERTNIGREAKLTLEEIAKSFDSKLFDTKIRECVKAREAQIARQTLIKYARGCTTERDYEDFVEEYLGI